MPYDIFKQKLGYGARPSIFEIVMEVPKAVITKLGIDAKTVTDDLKFYVSGTQIPGRTIGEVVVNYQGEEVKLSGDPVYDNLTYTFLNDVDYFTRNLIEMWCELIVNPENNERANPTEYETTPFVYQVGNKVDTEGNKERKRGWKLEGGFPTNFAAIDKSWDTKDTVETSTFTLRYAKYRRVNTQGQVIV